MGGQLVPEGQETHLTANYRVVDFSWDLAKELAPKVARGDAKECAENGLTTEEAMAIGGMSGGAYIAMWDFAPESPAFIRSPRPIGVFGWTTHGVIWSLWADLTLEQQKAVLRESPKWVRQLVAESGCLSLRNRIHMDNITTLRWLKATDCFDFATPYRASAEWVSFYTKPSLAPVIDHV